MKKTFILLILMALPGITPPLPDEEDSTWTVLRATTGEDKLEILHGLQQQFLYEAKDWYYNNLLMDEAIAQGNIVYQSIAWANRVAYHYRFPESDSVFYYAAIAEDFAKKYKQNRELFMVKQVLIQRYFDQGNYSMGLKKAMEMNEEATAQHCPQAQITALISLAKAYQTFGCYDESILYLEKALAIDNSMVNAPYMKLECYLFLAVIFHEIGDYRMLDITADKLEIEIERLKETQAKFNLTDFEVAADLFEIEVCIFEGRLSSAERRMKHIEERLESQHMPLMEYHLNEMKLYYHAALNDLTAAKPYFNRCMTYATDNNLETEIRRLLRYRAALLNEKELYQEAATAYSKLLNRSDSINQSRFLAEINQLRMDYELDKREDEILTQKRQLELRLHFNLILGVLASLLFITSLIIWRYLLLIRKKNRLLFHQLKESTENRIKLQEFQKSMRENFGISGENCPKSTNPLYDKVDAFMQKKKPYLNSEYGRQNLVTDMNTNEVYLANALRKACNLTLHEYLNQWRLEHAKKLLLTNRGLTVEAVALSSGFTSERTFYRLFKESYGMSPTAFRHYSESTPA